MMITCPKCQFSQPKDRYCANCGLDIENYKPAPEPFIKKIWNNSTFQITLMVALVLLISYGVLKKVQKGMDIESNQSSQSERTQDFNPTQTAQQFNEPVKGAGDDFKSHSSGDIHLKAEAIKPARMEEAKVDKDQTVPAMPKSIRLQFGHFSTRGLEVVSEDHQNIGDSLEIYVIENKQKKFSEIQAAENKYFSIGSPDIALFENSLPLSNSHMATNPETNEEYGLSYTLSKRVISPNEVQWTLKINYFLPQPENTEPVSFSAEENFTSTTTSSVLIANLFKGVTLGEKELSQLKDTPLTGLGASEYVSREADLVLFIEFL